jgi:hypothetical protein
MPNTLARASAAATAEPGEMGNASNHNRQPECSDDAAGDGLERHPAKAGRTLIGGKTFRPWEAADRLTR